MLAKRFFYVSAALFMLALTYHLGARQADAQAPGNSVVATYASTTGATKAGVLTANGDVYSINQEGDLGPTYRGNIFNMPTSATPTTWGKVKADYRK